MPADIRVIACIGRRGQIGLDDELPWPREQGDSPWFRSQTVDGILIAGPRTGRKLQFLHGVDGRTLLEWRRGEGSAVLTQAVDQAAGRVIWIVGGAQTYRFFFETFRRAAIPYKLVLTMIDYDGPADTWFPWDALVPPA